MFKLCGDRGRETAAECAVPAVVVAVTAGECAVFGVPAAEVAVTAVDVAVVR